MKFFILAIFLILSIHIFIIKKQRDYIKIGDERFKIAVSHALVSYFEYNNIENSVIVLDGKLSSRHGFVLNKKEKLNLNKEVLNFSDYSKEKIMNTIISMKAELNEAKIEATADGLDGKTYYYVVKMTAIRNSKNELLKILCSALDVTNEKEILIKYEESIKKNELLQPKELSSMLANISDNVIEFTTLNGYSNVDKCNDKNYDNFLDEWLGYTPDKEHKKLMVKTFSRKNIIKSYNSGHRDTTIIVRIYIHEKLTWLEVAISIVKDPFSNKIMCIFKGRNAEDREAIQSALDLATQASNAKSSFLSSVSHEIRTPMNAILGMTDMALDNIKDNNTSEVRKNLEDIRVSSDYLLSLINDILQMGRIENSKTILNKQTMDMPSIFNTVYTIISSEANEKGIIFNYTVDPKIRECYTGDEIKLKKILINLLGNAVKFTPSGGKVTINAYLLFENENRSMIGFDIEDTGIGISEDFLKDIYEPFSRELSDDTQYAGTGLGMSITQNYIKLMEGDIDVQSEIDKGTKVKISLILENCPDYIKEKQLIKEKTITAKRKVNHTWKRKKFENKRVLIVEDNNINMKIANNMLSKMGFNVEKAENGKIAVDEFSNHDENYYDLILMDIRMPIMDGLDSTKMIRKSNKKYATSVPIIAMTANAFDFDKQTSLNAGMNAHITKPVDIDELADLLIKELKA